MTDNIILITTSLIVASSGGISDVNIMDMISDAGILAKLVLLILLFMSLISWTIIIQKLRIFGQTKKENRGFIIVYSEKGNLGNINSTAKKFKNSSFANIFIAGYDELLFSVRSRSKENDPVKQGEQLRKVTMRDIDSIQRALDRAVQREVSKFEKTVTFLATTGSAGPFIGLFGTVWGVMVSFQGIGAKGSASIAVVAPGISEALIATAAGLAAAVPAAIFYNFIVNRIRVHTNEMEDFTSDFMDYVEKKILKD